MYFGKAQIEITGLLHVPILDVPVNAELRGAQLDVTDLVAGEDVYKRQVRTAARC